MGSAGLTNASDHDLYQLGLRMARVLKGQPTDDHDRDIAQGQAAYQILYGRYAERLITFIRDDVLFGEEYHEFAEDTAQTVFMRLWQRELPTTPGVELWPLLRRWAEHRARDIARKYAKLRKRQGADGEEEHARRLFNNVTSGQLESKTSRDPDPSRSAQQFEVSDPVLARVIESLPEADRQLVEDRFLKRVSMKELVDRWQKPGEDRARCKRRIYQTLHRFRTRVRRIHPRTPASTDAALERLRRVLVARAIDADGQLDALRAEREVRGDDRVLLADMLVAVARVRKRIARRPRLDGAISWLDDLVFRLRLRTGAADLVGIVREELDRVEEYLHGDEVDPAHDLRPLLESLDARELVGTGRQLRRIADWLHGPRTRGVDALADLLLEVRLRIGGTGLGETCRRVQERLLGRIVRPTHRRETRELLPPHEDTTRWRQLLKLVLRAERSREAWTDEQVVAGVAKICRD